MPLVALMIKQPGLRWGLAPFNTSLNAWEGKTAMMQFLPFKASSKESVGKTFSGIFMSGK